jgi:hypothetical protein
MFPHAQLHIESLAKNHSRKDVRTANNNLLKILGI